LTLNETHIFFAGGGLQTFILNWPQKKWTILDDILADISFGACGLLNDEGKFSTFFVINHSNYDLTEVLIVGSGEAFFYNLADNSWRLGLALPKTLENLASAQAPYGFYAVGGRNEDAESVDSVFFFGQRDYSWREMEATLKTSRYFSSAHFIEEESFFEC